MRTVTRKNHSKTEFLASRKFFRNSLETILIKYYRRLNSKDEFDFSDRSIKILTDMDRNKNYFLMIPCKYTSKINRKMFQSLVTLHNLYPLFLD